MRASTLEPRNRRFEIEDLPNLQAIASDLGPLQPRGCLRERRRHLLERSPRASESVTFDSPSELSNSMACVFRIFNSHGRCTKPRKYGLHLPQPFGKTNYELFVKASEPTLVIAVDLRCETVRVMPPNLDGHSSALGHLGLSHLAVAVIALRLWLCRPRSVTPVLVIYAIAATWTTTLSNDRTPTPVHRSAATF
jgi:hypothetical protein